MENAIARVNAEELAQKVSAVTTLEIISRASKDPDVDIQKLERLMDLHERVLKREAEMEFSRAMQAAQAEMPRIKKDAKNSQTNSTYARLETMNKLIVPIYTRHGFSLSYGTTDCPIPGHYRVTCEVRHTGGHSAHYQADVPADHLGPKGNPTKSLTHAFGSTMKYGQRYLARLIFNVVETDEDDDGQGAGGGKEGPEVIVGLKAMLWKLLTTYEKVPKGGTWDTAEQYLIDEMWLPEGMTVRDAIQDSTVLRKILAAASKKLEGK